MEKQLLGVLSIRHGCPKKSRRCNVRDGGGLKRAIRDVLGCVLTNRSEATNRGSKRSQNWLKRNFHAPAAVAVFPLRP